MSDFKVGDEIQVYDGTPGRIAFGPYETPYGGPMYLVGFANGTHQTYGPDQISSVPKFEIGDLASGDGLVGTSAAGPFDSQRGPWWVVLIIKGFHTVMDEDMMEKA